MDKTLAWLWLADAVGSACQNARDLLALYPDPEALYEALRAGREAPPYFLSDHAAAQLCDTTPFDYEERLDHCLLTGVEIITPDDAAYPDRLRDLPDMPLVLYVTGESACLNGHRYVGMVGTRRPSAYGRQAAFDLSLEMAKQGAVIVSGLADGLDSEGHRAAVEAGTPTVAFLGTAIDTTYPAANVKLRQRIEKGGGAVCSEYPPGYQGKQKGTFLARNRLIAGLSEVLCVAEARIRSGTAPKAREPTSCCAPAGPGCCARQRTCWPVWAWKVKAPRRSNRPLRWNKPAPTPRPSMQHWAPRPKAWTSWPLPPACPPAGCWPPVPNWSCTAVHKVSRDGAMSPCKI